MYINVLSDSQKDLIRKIFDEGMSIKDYAAGCGVKQLRNNLAFLWNLSDGVGNNKMSDAWFYD